MNLIAQHNISVIKKNAELTELLDKGVKINTKYGLFFYNSEGLSDTFRFAVLIKKNVGKAIWRNYCKRIVRTYIRNRLKHLLHYKQIIFLYTYTGKVKYSYLEEEFDKRLQLL